MKTLYLKRLNYLCECSCQVAADLAENSSKQALLGRLSLAQRQDTSLEDSDLAFIMAVLCTMPLRHEEVLIVESFARFRLQTDMETVKRKPWIYSFFCLLRKYLADFSPETLAFCYSDTCCCVRLYQMNWATLESKVLALGDPGISTPEQNTARCSDQLQELGDAVLAKTLWFQPRRQNALALHKRLITFLLDSPSHRNGSQSRVQTCTVLRVYWILHASFKRYFKKEDLSRSAWLAMDNFSSSLETHNLVLSLAMQHIQIPVAILGVYDAEYERSHELVQASWWYLCAVLRRDDSHTKKHLIAALHSTSKPLQRAAAYWVLSVRLKNDSINFLVLCILETLPWGDPLRTSQRNSLGWGEWIAQRSNSKIRKLHWSVDSESGLLTLNKL